MSTAGPSLVSLRGSSWIIAFALMAGQVAGASAETSVDAGHSVTVVRESGDANCHVYGPGSVQVRANGIVVGANCSGMLVRELGPDGATVRDARRAATWNEPSFWQWIDRVVTLSDGRVLAAGAAEGDDRRDTPWRPCQFVVSGDDGVLRPLPIRFDVESACGQLRATTDGGFVYTAVRRGYIARVARHDADGTLRWEREISGPFGQSMPTIAIDVAGNDVYIAYVRRTAGAQLTIERVAPSGTILSTQAHGIENDDWPVDLRVRSVPYVLLRNLSTTTTPAFARVVRAPAGAPLQTRQVAIGTGEVLDARWFERGGDFVIALRQFASNGGTQRDGLVAIDASLQERWRQVFSSQGVIDADVRADGTVVATLGLSAVAQRVVRVAPNGALLADLTGSFMPSQVQAVRWLGNDLVIAGTNPTIGNGSGDLAIVRVGANGTAAWQVDEGVQPIARQAVGVAPVPDGGWLIAVAPRDLPGAVHRFDDGVAINDIALGQGTLQFHATNMGALANEYGFGGVTTLTSFDNMLAPRWSVAGTGGVDAIASLGDGSIIAVLDDATLPGGGNGDAFARYAANGTRTNFTSIATALPGSRTPVGIVADGAVARVAGALFMGSTYLARIEADGNIVVTGTAPAQVDDYVFLPQRVVEGGDVLRVSTGVFGVDRIRADGTTAWRTGIPGTVIRRVLSDGAGGAWVVAGIADNARWTSVFHIDANGLIVSDEPSGEDIGHEVAGAAVLSFGGGLVVVGIDHRGTSCDLVATGFRATTSRAFQWRVAGGALGCHTFRDIVAGSFSVNVLADSPLPGEGRRAVLYTIETPVFGDGFE